MVDGNSLRHTLISIALVGCIFNVHQARGEIDFEYQCIIVSAPSDTDRSVTLPGGIDNVPLGNSVYVEFWATDSGSTNTGIVSAGADLDYPEDCVLTDTGSIAHSALFSMFPSGTDTGSTIDELGGSQLAGDVGLEPEWVRIAYVEFTVEGTCQAAVFQLLPAVLESSAFHRGLVPPSDIGYGNCHVTCGNPPPIPTMSDSSVVALMVLVLVAGTLVLRRRTF